MLRNTTLLVGLFLTACASAPDVGQFEGLAAGPALRVEMLDALFVRVDGERLAHDEFVYRMRIDCAAWKRRGERAPDVSLSAAPAGEGTAEALRSLMQQLRLAGVSKINVGAR